MLKKNNSHQFLFLLSLIILLSGCQEKPVYLSLHPENSHYFIFRGKPVVLIGSTEHYGAVLNPDFDYIKYLDETASKGLNITRTFTGIYLEPDGAFGIVKNTLAPLEGRLICPWARSSEPGYAFGGNKFDLLKWDETYFSRLKDFIAEAGKRNIIVELDLFSNFYDTLQWKLSPLYYSNNINNVEMIKDQKEVLSMRHPELLKIQETMVQKIVSELKEFDNLYYEVCNEPYFGDLEALETWEQHMTGIIADAEEGFHNKHLISQNIANGSQKIESPNPKVSIFNFHYAKPPVTVALNYSLNKVIGDNETGFSGNEDVNYRTEAWDFMVAGGGLYNNLDYSFTTENEDGSFDFPSQQPGGGGANLRSQLGILKLVFDELDFVAMQPSNYVLKKLSGGPATCRVLGWYGEQYLVYINNTQTEQTDYSLRYSSYLTAPETGTYWFKTYSDDGIRLWIDDSLLINNWTDHGVVADSAQIDLSTLKKHVLKIEYYQSAGGATLEVFWKRPERMMEKLPVTFNTALDSKTPGYYVEKFQGIDVKIKTSEGTVTNIDPIGIAQKSAQKEELIRFSLVLPGADYSCDWIDTKTGVRTAFNLTLDKTEEKIFNTPEFKEDIALKIVKRK